MRRLFSVYFLIFFMLASQVSGQKSIYLGHLGGLTAYKGKKIFDDSNDLSLFKTGFNAGIALQVRFGKSFFIQPEINITRRGFKTINLEYTSTQTYEYKYGVTTLYGLMQFGVAFNVGSFRGYFLTGPSIGLGLGGRIISTVASITGAGQPIYDSEPCGLCATTDVSLSVGVGLSYDLGPGAFTLNLRSVPTLSIWINELTGLEIISQNAIEFSVGYLFRLTKKREKPKEFEEIDTPESF